MITYKETEARPLFGGVQLLLLLLLLECLGHGLLAAHLSGLLRVTKSAIEILMLLKKCSDRPIDSEHILWDPDDVTS